LFYKSTDSFPLGYCKINSAQDQRHIQPHHFRSFFFASLFQSLETESHEDLLNSKATLRLDIKGEQQRVDIESTVVLPWFFDAEGKWQMRAPLLDVKLHHLTLMLPRVSPTQPLPMLVTDSRFKTQDSLKSEKTKSQKAQKKTAWNMDLVTEEAIVLKTSLINADLRIALDLKLSERGIETGTVELLPIKLEILKRPIELEKFVIRWTSPTDTDLLGRVLFKLPEYRIFLKLAGTLESPRLAFESDPPLGTDDIYSVLLFGQPMTELDPEGRQGMARVKQGLAQGLFSLSTLYLLAGSRIESLGYNPETSEVSASVRIDSRHSVRVGARDGGRESVALRRSLGGGWFVESKAQQTGAQGEEGPDFGLMLQRVIAY
jgi:hypothetical protein